MQLTKSASVFALLLFLLISPRLVGAQDRAPDVTPQALSERRVKLYFQAAREPMGKLASEVYDFAANSERCRLDSGAKECGLPAYPLKSTDLKQIYDYYVAQPVEAALDRQHIKVSKSNWTWQARGSEP